MAEVSSARTGTGQSTNWVCMKMSSSCVCWSSLWLTLSQQAGSGTGLDCWSQAGYGGEKGLNFTVLSVCPPPSSFVPFCLLDKSLTGLKLMAVSVCY